MPASLRCAGGRSPAGHARSRAQILALLQQGLGSPHAGQTHASHIPLVSGNQLEGGRVAPAAGQM